MVLFSNSKEKKKRRYNSNFEIGYNICRVLQTNWVSTDVWRRSQLWLFPDGNVTGKLVSVVIAWKVILVLCYGRDLNKPCEILLLFFQNPFWKFLRFKLLFFLIFTKTKWLKENTSWVRNFQLGVGKLYLANQWCVYRYIQKHTYKNNIKTLIMCINIMCIENVVYR